MAAGQPGTPTLSPSPDHPGWLQFPVADPLGFNCVVLGPTLVRRESDTRARVRILPQRHFANALGHLHGGALLGLADMSLFATLAILTGRDPTAAVTLDLNCQFIGSGRIDQPLDSVVELLRETGRLAFLRGTAEQGETLIGSFQSTVRKLDPAR